jgi:type II secretory pathway pseudopilin PulG
MKRQHALFGFGGLVVGLVVGFLFAVTVQNLLTAAVRSKAKRSVADCRSISLALEKYRHDRGKYPPLDGHTENLTQYLVPSDIPSVPTKDAFGQPYVVCMRGEKAAIVAPGRYGAIVEGGLVVSSAGWDAPLQ